MSKATCGKHCVQTQDVNIINQDDKTKSNKLYLRFVLDSDENIIDKYHYVTVHEGEEEEKATDYYTILYDEPDKIDFELENEISREILKQIEGLDFGGALIKIKSEYICNLSYGQLQDECGVDRSTIAAMARSERLSVTNVVSICLGIHVPYAVSQKLLYLAGINIDVTIPGALGEKNRLYDHLLHDYWRKKYVNTYNYVNNIDHGHNLIHQPSYSAVVKLGIGDNSL